MKGRVKDDGIITDRTMMLHQGHCMQLQSRPPETTRFRRLPELIL
jgi:hypothetical protein